MIGYLVSILGGGVAGSIVTNIISNYRNRLQNVNLTLNCIINP